MTIFVFEQAKYLLKQGKNRALSLESALNEVQEVGEINWLALFSEKSPKN